MLQSRSVPLERLEARAYAIPTDRPEADGTFEWNATTIVVVQARAAGKSGLGYSYTHQAAAKLVNSLLAPAVALSDALAVPRAWAAMVRQVRNLGRPGLASCAIAAVDVALWDLGAKILEVPLATLLGLARLEVPLYASGGFTSYPPEVLREQLGGWAAGGFERVKMKVGADPAADIGRVELARRAIGPRVALFVDANGAYGRKQALSFAMRFAEQGVSWFEEPVSSDDLEGLRLLRDRAPPGMDIAAGEYGDSPPYFRRMLEHGAVDVLQADATRCGGITGFMRVAALADAFGIALSAHTAPALHLHACCAAPRLAHLEWFHDHVRIERLLFDGVIEASGGVLVPDLSRPGLGLELKERDADGYALA